MRSLLKLVVILCCVQKGDSHWLRSLTGKCWLKKSLWPMTFLLKYIFCFVCLILCLPLYMYHLSLWSSASYKLFTFRYGINNLCFSVFTVTSNDLSSVSVILHLKCIIFLVFPSPDQKREAVSPHTATNEDRKNRYSAEEDSEAEAPEDGPSPSPKIAIPVRSPRSTLESQCGLRSVLLQVRDLGLGYDSDETVLFRYCSGTCPRVRSNHDLTLTNLLLSGMLPHSTPEELWHNTPCCRPTHHEDMAFLDNSHRWHKLEKLLAAGCSCVG